MAKISKYIKLDKNILLEYVYDDNNNISEAYDILVNSKEKSQSYMATSTSGTGNTQGNQLFRLDAISNKYGKIDTSNYSFLQVKNYTTPVPIRHDTVRVHLPINWTFGEYLGFYIKIYAFDTTNQKKYSISNFYFDMTDVSQQYLMNFTSPPLLFQEKLWGKNISIEIPSVSSISAQRVNNLPKDNSLNSNLTSGIGLNMTSPIFIEFNFINGAQTVNGVTSYSLAPKVETSIPQSPEFESLGLAVKHSINGDFFEIYGTYNDTIAGFKQFIDDSFISGNRYYVQYNITTYEQNVRGKTVTALVTDNFNETIEYRPIIKYSTTSAIIDVEMRLIDAVDDSYIIRRASYGMLQDEVAKYSLNLIKINLKNANKPKIYNIKNSVDPALVGVSNSMGSLKLKKLPALPAKITSPTSAASLLGVSSNITQNSDVSTPSATSPNILATSTGLVSNVPTNSTAANNTTTGGNAGSGAANVVIQTVQVPFPVLMDRYNVIGKSENSVFENKTFFGTGKMQILFYPFDNVFKFSVATGLPTQPQYFDMTGFDEVKFIIKNDKSEVSSTLYTETGEVNLKIGQLVFKIPQAKFNEVKKIHDSGVNVFYIIGTSKNITSVIYTGLYKIYDSKNNVSELNKQSSTLNKQLATAKNNQQEIILDKNIKSNVKEVAAKAISEQAPTLKPTGLKDSLSALSKIKFRKPNSGQNNN
jgi:hypothetical protein